MRFTPGLVLAIALVSPVARSANPPPAADQAAPADERKQSGAAPSDAFSAFVASLPIRAADPRGRILAGPSGSGRLFRIGDVVDATIGVRLHSVRVESGVATIVFEEKTGALLARQIPQK